MEEPDKLNIRQTPLSLSAKFNVVICLALSVLSLVTVIFPISTWILGVALFFIPWVLYNLIVEQRKFRQLKREARRLEWEYQQTFERLDEGEHP